MIAQITTSPEEQAEIQHRTEALERHAAFRAEKDWKKKIYEDAVVLAVLTPENSRIVVSLGDQRGMLLTGDKVAIDYPISSGTKSHPTPTGSYTVLERSEKYSSNLYGKIVDAAGAVVKSSADRLKDSVPEGGSFVGAPMPYWIRFTGSGVGMHVGHLPGRPASHGCVRMPKTVAPKIYSRVKCGTPVELVELYTPPTL